ncbi:hypothetical protein NQZ68_029027, partial [Dissostichus eleginoides]
ACELSTGVHSANSKCQSIDQKAQSWQTIIHYEKDWDKGGGHWKWTDMDSPALHDWGLLACWATGLKDIELCLIDETSVMIQPDVLQMVKIPLILSVTFVVRDEHSL